MKNPKPGIESLSGAEVLDAVASFLRQYLVCDDHQLIILTLWTACVHSYQHFFSAPYLDIRSPEIHSGKSLCLRLLHNLCRGARHYYGVPGSALFRLLLAHPDSNVDADEPPPPYALFFDDCHHTLGSSERQPLLSLLNSGSIPGRLFPFGEEGYYLFCPKAFAGNSPLPRSLAGRCIPIVLRRPKPSETFARCYHTQAVEEAADQLAKSLNQWLEQNSSALAEAAQYDPAHPPLTLSLGQRKCSEPLLHVADLARGRWPAKARLALAAVFPLADGSPSLQMLSDLRAIFRLKNNPEYLSTTDLLSLLRTLDSRPWSAWGDKSGRRLGALLRPFEIASHYLHYGSEGGFRGYLATDFQDAWERYLPPLDAAELDEQSSPPCESGDPFRTKFLSETASETGISAIDAG